MRHSDFLLGLVFVASWGCGSDGTPVGDTLDVSDTVLEVSDTADTIESPDVPDTVLEVSDTLDAADTTPDVVTPTFLDPASYADILVIAADFPFGVIGRHAADGDVIGARWGRHGGPMVTTQVYGQVGPGQPGVIRWSVPADAQSPMTSRELVFAAANNLPVALYYGADGMVDLPYGPYALLSYSGAGVAYPGEAFLYAPDYDAVVARAHVNGFYSGVGFGTAGLVYAGLSPLSAARSTTNDNGLYAAELCAGAWVATGDCRAPVKLFGWSGASGPVAIDPHGNAFVAAYLGRSGASDAVLGIAADDLAAFAPTTAVTLTEANTQGTGNLAVVGPVGAAPGWVLAKGFDLDVAGPAYAQAYTANGELAPYGGRLDDAIAAGPNTESFSLFAGENGDLWVAVDLSSGSPRHVFLRVTRR